MYGESALEDLETDREWLDQFKNGVPEALSRVYRRYSPDIIRLLRHGFSFRSQGRSCRFYGTKSAFELEDYLQETFTRAFSSKARWGYDGVTPYSVYIMSIGKNLIVDDYRRKERAMVSFGWPPVEWSQVAPLLNDLEMRVDGPDEIAETREFMALVESTVAALAPRERWVYRLRFIEEMEHREIAQITGYSVAKVKTSEERIRKLFFRNMREQGHLEGYEEGKRGWLRFYRPRYGERV